MLTRWMAVAALLLSPACAFGQTLADKVPGDAIVYIGWAGSDSLGPQYAGSHLKALIDASNARDLLDKTLPQIVDKIGQQDGNAAQMLRLAGSIADPMWRHPSAFYVENVDFSNPNQPQPRLTFLCDAGADAAALKTQLDKVVEQAGPTPVSIAVQQDGNLISVLIGPPMERSAIPKPLSQWPDFVSALAQVNKDPVLTVYIDVDHLVAQLNQAVRHAPDPTVKDNWPKLRDSLGLAGLHRIIKTAAFDGADWSTQAFVAAPAPRTGILPKLFDSKPLADDLLAVVPRSAETVSAAHFDLGALWDLIHDSVIQLSPDSQQQLDGGIGQINAIAGIDIRQDLLGSLGDQWVAYSAPTIGGNGMFGTVLVNPLKDADKAEKSLTAVQTTITNLAAQQMESLPVKLTFKEIKVGDNTVHYLATPMISPAWEIRDGKLYAALFPQVVAEAADFAASHDKSILDNETFRAVRDHLKPDGAKPVAIQFLDLPKTVPNSYQMLLMFSRLYMGLGEMFGIDTPPMLVPPISKLQKEVTPMMTLAWVDDAGLHARNQSPFPGASVLASPEQIFVVQEVATSLGILLPALSRSRETANAIKSASNLRQIGQGCLIYANDHKQNFPPDLGTMMNEEGLVPQVLLSPFHKGPEIPPGLEKDQLAAWINANGDYGYLGGGKTMAMTATQILAYEKPGLRRDGKSEVLFADGHIEQLDLSALQAQIDAQTNPPK